MGTAYRSCKLSNVGSSTTAIQLRRCGATPIGSAADSRGKPLSTLNSPAILFSDHAAPRRQTLDGMLLHPLRELRRAHQAGLH